VHTIFIYAILKIDVINIHTLIILNFKI
jgi:hypothetical protein